MARRSKCMAARPPQHVIVRFMSLTETQRGHARLKIENRRLLGDHEMLLGLLDVAEDAVLDAQRRRQPEMGQPRLCRRRSKPNRASLALRDSKEFLGTPGARCDRRSSTCRSPVFEQTLSTVIKGDRRMFAVTDFAGPEGSAGIAADVSDIETMRERACSARSAATPTRSTG